MKKSNTNISLILIIEIIVSLMLLGCLSLSAQTSEDIGKIALSVRIVENIDRLDAGQLSKLQSKITQIVTKSGLAASGYNQNFIIYPKFAIYDVDIAETGLKNIYITTTELSLYIKQVNSGVVYASVSKTLKGSGDNERKAITNAISNISASDKVFQQFIREGKEIIIAYYET